MTTTVTTSDNSNVRAERTYGNYARPGLPGVFGLSLGASLAGVLVILLMIGLFAAQQTAAAMLWAVLGIGGLMLTRLNGPTGTEKWNPYQRVGRWYAVTRARRTGRATLSQGPVGHTADGAFRLPGLLASSELTSEQDAYGHEFGLLSLPRANLHTVIIETYPQGSDGADPGVIDTQVDTWAAFLSQLSFENELVGAQVVVESAPDTGYRLRESMRAGLVSDAPGFSQRVLEESVQQLSAGASTTRTWLTLTFSGAGSEGVRGRTRAEVVEDIATRLPTLLADLSSTGAGAGCTVCTAQDITDFTRGMFDPTAALDIEQARNEGGTGLSWSEVGPAAAVAGDDQYVHDGCYSVSWQMARPRGVLFANSMKTLLEPSSKIARKRVALLYRPENPISSSSRAEQGVNSAQFKARQKKELTEAGRVAVEAARKTAQEEAMGATLIRFGMVLTVTVTNKDDLPLANKTLNRLAARPKLQLRRAYKSQDVAFTASMPLGLVLPRMTFLPDQAREVM